MKSLVIAHLYPELLNLYADKGNIQTLVRRLSWRGIPVEVQYVHLNDTLELSNYHLVLLGGGSDREQRLIGETLRPRRQEWKAAVEAGLPVLGICGGYQLLGEYYQLPDGMKVPGLEVLQMYTTAGTTRLIGNVAIDTKLCGTVVGFENHGGRTYHDHDALGEVIRGHGNNGEDSKEGIAYNNLIGTYIHGPLLPKNAKLADAVLTRALDYAGLPGPLPELDDTLEHSAHAAFLKRRIYQAEKPS